ncbi:MAG TPA: hydroxyacylglutathione hydrolase [Propylenella sp.]|nr:hydroxyacylglutathione hydrolase [Propylenella sp.]
MSAFEVVQFNARSDNFGVLLHDPQSGATAAIDAPDADAVMKEAQQRGWRLSHIFVTHKHLDHIEGIPALKAAYDCSVVGPEKSAHETGMYGRQVTHGDSFDWGGTRFNVLETPGHTLDHVSYHVPEQNLVFVGDTIFSLGCGRVIEGTHEMMWQSILRLRALPDETRLYCGHEYTLANGKFAVTIEPDNPALRERMAEVEKLAADGRPTLPTTIGREKATNPFLRADDPGLMAKLGMEGADPARVFGEIRMRKDRFRG